MWVREWQPLLASRGARVDAGLTFPTPEQLDNTDVLVMFAANAGTILGQQRASLEKFLRRGGGIACLHDAVVTAQDPHWFKTISETNARYRWRPPRAGSDKPRFAE